MAALHGERELTRGLCVAYSIELLSWVKSADGSLEQAAQLQSAARAVWAAMGIQVGYGPAVRGDSAAAMGRMAEGLGEPRLERLLVRQAGISVEEAVAFALRDGSAPRSQRRRSRAKEPFAERPGGEVADLIACGKSNKAIAATLIVSPRTVDGHVERILAKLGFQSRTQIAAWVSERRHATSH